MDSTQFAVMVCAVCLCELDGYEGCLASQVEGDYVI